jgi:hypothetical protein
MFWEKSHVNCLAASLLRPVAIQAKDLLPVVNENNPMYLGMGMQVVVIDVHKYHQRIDF